MSGQCVGYEKPLRGKEMRMKRDQKGFTIVELLIAVAILSIVVTAVCGFILVGSRSYAAGNSDISVQQEAQLALNQMSDVVIDTTRSVTYTGFDAGGTTTETALKDAEFSFTPEDKSLVMLNGTAVANPSGGPNTIEEGNGNKNYHFYWDKSEETLFYAEADVADPVPDFGDPTAEWVTLASHVTDFSVDLSQVEEKRVVMLALTFMDGIKEYVTSNNVTIRNKVGVNDAELAAINKKKTLVITPRDNAIIEPGETYHFSTPKVTGENVTDRSVTWALKPSADLSSGTYFTDDQNGILKVADDQKAGVITAVITTNAVDSDGNHASCDMDVHIKRVYPEGTGVVLAKTADTNADNGANEISPGCTFTVTATVSGYKLGEVCSVCGDDVSVDKQVNYQNNPYGLPHIWRVYDPSSENGATTNWNPNEYIDIIESAADHATFRLKDNAPTSDANTTYGVVIQCISTLSELGNAHGRHYDTWVPGAISFRMVKNKESAEPYKGKLKYGVNDLHEDVRAGLPTDYGKYVTAVRVKDNSGKEADKIVLHYTTGGGNNYRISPDLFDLDLNGSYTFYMQAIFPIPEDRYKGDGSGGVADDNATIWKEYYDNIQGHTASEGYTGTKYRHGKVFYAKLDRPKLTYSYKGVEYTGKNIFYDPVNIYTVGVGTGIVGEIKPTRYENIVEDNSVWNKIANSLYEGKGDNLSGWNKLYYADKDAVVITKDEQGNESYSFNYHGKNTLADGAVQIDPRGSMFLKLNSTNHAEKACGSYHIVPGMVYKNNDPGCFEIIGYAGFDLPNLKREARYYEFDDSTIHVEITDQFTMDIDHPDFKGQAMFPLPKEMKRNPLFMNMESMEWQTTPAKLTVKAKKDNSWNVEDLTFNYVRYRYIKSENTWEVEPVRYEYSKDTKKIRVHSYGTYKCGENDKKWWCYKAGNTTEKEFTIRQFDFNGSTYLADFPLPTDSDFPFTDGTGEIERTLELFDSNMNQAQNVPTFLVSCTKNGDTYEIEFRTEAKVDPWNANNHKIKVNYYGTYTWSPGQTEWTRVKGNSTDYKTDLVANLEGLFIDNTSCKMYCPLPSESKFPFKNSGEKISCTWEYVAYAVTDLYAEHPIALQYNYDMKYERNGNTHRITFVNRSNEQTEYGTFECANGETKWRKVN